MEALVIEPGQNGALATTNGLDLESLYNRFISFAQVRARSLETYRKAIKQFFNFLGARGIKEPTRLDIIAYKEALEAEGKKATTSRLYLTAVKLFFQWLDQEGIYKNVAAKIKASKIGTGFKKDYLTTAQAKALLGSFKRDTMESKRNYAIIRLSITTGLRTIEISRANIEDLRAYGDEMALYIQGKGRDEKAEFVKIPAKVYEAIREYLATRGAYDMKDPLFAGIGNKNAGGRLTTRTISGIEKAALIGAGLNSERLTAHSLRHTAATLNLLNGGTLEETKQLLRHTNINTTLIYAHALERANNQSEARIEAALG
jgi:integrase/recombinase XerC